MTTLPIQLLVSNIDDFRDGLPSSGVFDLMDCNVVVETNLHVSIEEMERYLTILKSCLNVVDIEFTSRAGSELQDDELLFTIYEIPVHVAENRPPVPKRVTKLTKPATKNHLPEKDEDELDI